MITVRLATLDDTAAITEIHKSEVPRWERIGADGNPVAVDYRDLRLFERWQHGGPWMSIESCAIHLNRLLAGSGIPLVACVDDEVVAEAEVYENFEPLPYGHHIEIPVIVSHARHAAGEARLALMAYIIQMARLMKCERVTASDVRDVPFYESHGFRRVRSGHGVRIPTQAGRAFYQSAELIDHNPTQVRGWYMPLGRYHSSRQEWENLFPQDWAAGIPDLLGIPAAYVKLTTSGHTAILYASLSGPIDMVPGDIHLACWSPKPLTGMLVTAILDWANRKGYRHIVSYIMEHDLPLLGPDAKPTEYRQDLYELAL